ncbi:2'-5' RNA ligase [Candidatus Micrarchaeota archaeon RBG_16_36_9]|nr:MAG: 2'-5' RNA ligase [Candidatus Micrarchaeota archaeon RBG_16_36_9]
MRAFLGISISEDLKNKILNIQKKFSAFDIKFVEPENLHFNLKFFREIENENIEKLRRVVEEIVKKYQPFDIEIRGLGVFPNKSYIRVVWIGVKEGYNNLMSLVEEIQNSIEDLGFVKEEKFVPHLTLGRVRTARNEEELKKLVEELQDVEIGSMKIDSIKLFQSKLSPKGPVYEEVFNAKI